MTRLFTNSDLLFILGECNIYYINYKYILLYLGLANTTFNNQYVYKNKKNITLMFFSGNNGNSGNILIKALKLQQSFVTTFCVFCYHCYHFSFWQSNLTSLYLRGFCGASSVLHNIDDWVVFCLNLRKVISNPSISRNDLYFSTFNWYFLERKKPPGNSI